MKHSLRDTVVAIAAGYSRSARRIAVVVALLAATVTISAGIVFPLWYFSIHDRRAYTLTVVALLAGAIVYGFGRRSRAFWALPARERRHRVRRLLAKAAVVLAYLIGLYIVLGLFAIRILVAAIPLSAVYLLALGYTLYVRKARQGT